MRSCAVIPKFVWGFHVTPASPRVQRYVLKPCSSFPSTGTQLGKSTVVQLCGKMLNIYKSVKQITKISKILCSRCIMYKKIYPNVTNLHIKVCCIRIVYTVSIRRFVARGGERTQECLPPQLSGAPRGPPVVRIDLTVGRPNLLWKILLPFSQKISNNKLLLILSFDAFHFGAWLLQEAHAKPAQAKAGQHSSLVSRWEQSSWN